MIKVEFEIDRVSAIEAQQVIRLLDQRFPGILAGFGAPRTAEILDAAPEPPVGITPSLASGAGPEKPKRGRPRKEAQPEVPAVDPTPAQNGSVADAEPSAEPPSQSAPAGETGPKSYTLDELRAGLQTYTGKHDLVKAKALLKSFGCDRITELAEKGPEVHRQFMKECEA